MQQSKAFAYTGTRFFLPVSNHTKWLLFIRKQLFSDKSRRLLHNFLETPLFLKVNGTLRNTALVSIVINKTGCEVDDPNQLEENKAD